jgi:6-phosphofructokinase 2
MTGVVTLTPNPAIDISTSVGKLEPTRKLRCAVARRDPGGGGINVARVIDRLGGDVTAVYPIGGATGRLLRRLVDREGIRSVTVEVREETREDFTVLEGASGAQYRFVLPGPNLDAGEWQGCLYAMAAIGKGAGYFVASGSLPLGAPDDFYARAARAAREVGARFVLDTSGAAFAAALGESVYLVKPNLGELSRLVGTALGDDASCALAAKSLIAAGRTEIVALTLGHRGALLVTSDTAYRAAPLPLKVVSAVGAGDSFLGAMVWSLARGDAILDAFKYGVAAGSAAVLAPGTELCHREAVLALFAEVRIEPL